MAYRDLAKRRARQSARYAAAREAGLCCKCGEPSPDFAECPGCAEARRTKARKEKRQTPWTPGGKGRPLVNFEKIEDAS